MFFKLYVCTKKQKTYIKKAKFNDNRSKNLTMIEDEIHE